MENHIVISESDEKINQIEKKFFQSTHIYLGFKGIDVSFKTKMPFLLNQRLARSYVLKLFHGMEDDIFMH